MNAAALRLDDVGAASKQHEVHGLTRVAVGRVAVPFPGNFLFLKYVPPIKRWGPYRELTPAAWEAILTELQAAGARMTVAITAGWVEADGSVVPFPVKFPAVAATLRAGVDGGLLEVANHGYTHCVLAGRRFRPRLFSGNRHEHREFYDWLPERTHREHLGRSQAILQEFFGRTVLTFVPPGNVFARKTLAAAAEVGIRYVSCLGPARWGTVDGITFVGKEHVVAIHDRDIVVGGTAVVRTILREHSAKPLVTVREVGERLEGARR